jgi:hypothetical protein
MRRDFRTAPGRKALELLGALIRDRWADLDEDLRYQTQSLVHDLSRTAESVPPKTQTQTRNVRYHLEACASESTPSRACNKSQPRTNRSIPMNSNRTNSHLDRDLGGLLLSVALNCNAASSRLMELRSYLRDDALTVGVCGLAVAAGAIRNPLRHDEYKVLTFHP